MQARQSAGIPLCVPFVALALFLFAPFLCTSAAIITLPTSHITSHAFPSLNTSTYPPDVPSLFRIVRDNPGVFSLLHAYVKQAPDIEALLKSPAASLTFFAPANMAFGRLTADQLALFESDVSTHLKYHLLPHAVAEQDMRDGSQEQTVQGSAVSITVQSARRDIWINDAYIVDGDHVATNGARAPMHTLTPPPHLACRFASRH